MSRKSLVLGRSAGFQTGLERVFSLVDTLQAEDTLSRFGNRRSGKDSRLPPPAHFCLHTFTLAPLPTSQDPGGKGCGTTSNLPRLTRIPRTET